MLHLTLNSGNLAEHPDDWMSQGAVAAFQPLIAAGGGGLPKPFVAFRVEIARTQGGAVFTLFRARDPVVTCGVAWSEEGGQEIWAAIEAVYLEVSDRVPSLIAATAVAECPGSLPWLAAVLLPGFILTARDDIGWLGDFERQLAFALLRYCRAE